MVLAIARKDNGWLADVCKGDRRISLLVGFRGSVLDETAAGDCRSEKVLDVLQTLETRGANSVRAFVEGCFKGAKYRWSFDRLGKRAGRERIGSCG